MKKQNILLLLLILLVTSCRAPRELVYQNIQNFGISQSPSHTTLVSMDIRLYNPNNYALKLKKADVEVFINNNLVGKLNARSGCTLSGCDTASVPVTLEVDMKTVLPNMLQFILNSEVDIRLSGKIKAGRHGIYVSVPVSYEGKQDILSGIK
jgi:LEA14-like dessication related protein